MFFKKGKKSTKETEETTPQISSFTINLDEMFTTFELLESHEENKVLSSLCDINEFINKYTKQGMDFLEGYDITARIIDNLAKSCSTRLMTMKIIIKLLAVDSTLPALKKSHKSFTALLNIFEQSSNTIEIEYSANLLSKICHKKKYAEIITTDPIIDRLFNLVVQTPDPDVKGYCLKMLHCIVGCVPKRNTVAESPYFNLIVLNLILQVHFKFLREIVVDILYIISDYNSESMQNKLFKNNTVLYLFDILLEKKWTITQNKAINTIYNCIKYNPIQTQCIETKKFLHMVAMPKDNPDIDLHHTLAIISLITKFAEVSENLQVMVDFRVYELLREYCQFNCDKISMRFCDAVFEFAKNSRTIETLANITTLREIRKILRKTKLPWIPYRQAGIRPLHSFLMNDPDLSIFFSECNIIRPLQDAVLSKSQIDSQFYKMTLEIFQCMHQYTRLVVSLWTKDVYEQFVGLLIETDEKIFDIALNVLQSTLYNDSYRCWFLKFNGLEKIAVLLTNDNQDRVDEVIKFLKCATKYKDICCALVTAGMVQTILDCSETYVNLRTTCESIITDIYRIGLSVKFYITGILNYTEKTKNGFCICTCDIPQSCPTPSEKELTKDSLSHTVITINFRGGKDTVHSGVKDFISTPVLKSPKTNEDIQEYTISCEKQVNQLVNDDSPVPQTSTAMADDCKMTYKLVLPPPPLDYDPIPDYYLKKCLKAARNLMVICNNYTIKEKIQVLAKFVASNLSGHEIDIPLEQQFQNHITELKEKLKSNHIPLGYLRMGTMVERALLFKVLADKVNIACTLQRGEGSIAWNEVCVGSVFDNNCSIPQHLQSNFYGKCIVDLMANIGNLILRGTDCANCYCAQRSMDTCETQGIELVTKYINKET